MMTWKAYRAGILIAATGVLAAGCMTVPEEDPVWVQARDNDQRLERIERVMDNDSLLELIQQVDSLQNEVRQLRGEMESMAHDVDGATGRQRDLYVDVDNRLQKLERGGVIIEEGPGGQTTLIATGNQPLPVPNGTDRENYQAAIDLLQDGRYQPAAAAFQRFLGVFPESQYADNAQYWYAETHYVTREFEQALGAFQIVINDYPRSRKIPDAMLKIGYCNYELKRWDAARNALSQVTADYPNSTAANLAQRRLSQMDGEGH